jgi:hypothetical protein
MFKNPILAYDAETWTLTKRNKSKMQAMDMKCGGNIEGESSARITNEILRAVGIQIC